MYREGLIGYVNTIAELLVGIEMLHTVVTVGLVGLHVHVRRHCLSELTVSWRVDLRHLIIIASQPLIF